MSIKIEDFIRDHKREFDQERPAVNLWDKIEKELDGKHKKKRFNIQLWAGIAASLLLVLGISLVYTFQHQKNHFSVADVNPAYASKQVRFTSMIEQKKDSLEIFATSNPDLYRKFNADLEKLNITYEALRKDLPASPNQQMIVKAMVKNLEIQLQLVSQQLMIISEVTTYKKENSI